MHFGYVVLMADVVQNNDHCFVRKLRLYRRAKGDQRGFHEHVFRLQQLLEVFDYVKTDGRLDFVKVIFYCLKFLLSQVFLNFPSLLEWNLAF